MDLPMLGKIGPFLPNIGKMLSARVKWRFLFSLSRVCFLFFLFSTNGTP
jgi:hypothetical protein